MWSDRETLERIRAAVPLTSLAEEVTTLRRSGAHLKGICPFHGETEPSFFIITRQDASEFYFCFGCKAAGDVFSFVQRLRGYTFPEAVEYLALRAGIALDQKSTTEVAMVGAAVRRFIEACAANLEAGAAWLASRGVGLDTARAFGLGAAGDGAWFYRVMTGISPEALRLAGLLVSDRPSIVDRIVFPLRDQHGVLVGCIARATRDDQSPKYYSLRNNILLQKRLAWFGLEQARQAIRSTGTVYIVEGPLDAIAVTSVGYPQTVAVCGTAVTAQHAAMIARWNARPVLVYDGDQAGLAGMARLFPVFAGVGAWAHYVTCPFGTDPADCWRDEALREALRAALAADRPLIELWIEGFEDAPGRATKIVRALATITDPLLREQCVSQVAERLGVPATVLRMQSGCTMSASDMGPWGPPVPRGRFGVDAAVVAIAVLTDAHDTTVRYLAWSIPEPFRACVLDLLALPVANRVARLSENAAVMAVVGGLLTQSPDALLVRAERLIRARNTLTAVAEAPRAAANADGALSGGTIASTFLRNVTANLQSFASMVRPTRRPKTKGGPQ